MSQCQLTRIQRLLSSLTFAFLFFPDCIFVYFLVIFHEKSTFGVDHFREIILKVSAQPRIPLKWSFFRWAWSSRRTRSCRGNTNGPLVIRIRYRIRRCILFLFALSGFCYKSREVSNYVILLDLPFMRLISNCLTCSGVSEASCDSDIRGGGVFSLSVISVRSKDSRRVI